MDANDKKKGFSLLKKRLRERVKNKTARNRLRELWQVKGVTYSPTKK